MKRTPWFMLTLLVVAAALSLSAPAEGEDAAQHGKRIATEADKRVRNYGDERVEMVMILRDRRGKETRRQIDATALESGDVDKSLVIFRSPPDIRGTAILTYSYRDKDDEQWLYLPALKRTKRISSSNRSSPFMGSELAYEDLASYRVHDYSYRFLREEKLRNTDCFVIERYPNYKGSGYKRQQVWLDTKEYRPLQIVYFDRRDRKLKTFSLGGYRKYDDRHWRPSKAKMVNHRTKAVTRLLWKDYRFGSGLRDSDFARGSLTRGR